MCPALGLCLACPSCPFVPACPFLSCCAFSLSHTWLLPPPRRRSYMDGGRIAFSGSPDEMRAYLRRLGAVM